MTSRYSRSELKDLVIDALLGQVAAAQQLSGKQSLLAASLRREIQLHEDVEHLSDTLAEYKKAFSKGVPDFITKANLAQNGPPDVNTDTPAATAPEARGRIA